MQESIKDNKGNTIEIHVSWHIEDVLTYARDNGYKITRKQASDVLDDMLNNHDATIGINWDVIDFHINNIGCKRKERV